MLVIGITGGVGSGKSKVLEELNTTYGAYIVEADRLAHTLMEPGKAAYKGIVACFGEEILCKEEPFAIDRGKLGSIVFNNQERLKQLDEIVHPIVKDEIKSLIRQKQAENCELFVIEAALLIQDGYKAICDEIWYVWASKEIRVSRLMESRGYTKERCISMFDSQAEDAYYQSNSNYIINNDGDYLISSKQIKDRLNKLCTNAII